jgi:hypothetical protein
MHIPKTAGFSVVKAFERRFGPANCEIFSAAISDENFAEKAFVSGHVGRDRITANAFVFTFLRNPYHQLASHLKWIDHYNMPEFAYEAEGFSAPVREAFRRLAKVDFDDAKSLGGVLDWLDGHPHLRVKDVQSAMLALPPGPLGHRCRDELARDVAARLRSFDFIGLAERVGPDLARLYEILGFRQRPKLAHYNRSPARRSIDVANPEIRKVMRRHLEMDLFVYYAALRMREEVLLP